MKWTTDKPTKPGWYWKRMDFQGHKSRKRTVEVFESGKELWVQDDPNEANRLDDYPDYYEWAGPIPEPEN